MAGVQQGNPEVNGGLWVIPQQIINQGDFIADRRAARSVRTRTRGRQYDSYRVTLAFQQSGRVRGSMAELGYAGGSLVIDKPPTINAMSDRGMRPATGFRVDAYWHPGSSGDDGGRHHTRNNSVARSPLLRPTRIT